ncbi:bifunctional deaminase-reductase domain protein [Actinobacteria bacterium OK074]|nr:bifunctional deaminase-reductase domain protein [Actinobacteria bacterium OK074]
MRKIVLSMSVSLDGYIEGPGRDISWHRVNDELHQHFNDFLKNMGAFLSGRVTHQLMADFWPTADRDPDASATVVEFAGIWRNMPKVVFSRTLEHADWHTTIVREVVPADIRALKAQDGGDLVVSGAQLVGEFLRLGLVDEMRVYVHPVLIGRGTRLFPVGDDIRASLRLVESRAFSSGVVLLRYTFDDGDDQQP